MLPQDNEASKTALIVATALTIGYLLGAFVVLLTTL